MFTTAVNAIRLARVVHGLVSDGVDFFRSAQDDPQLAMQLREHGVREEDDVKAFYIANCLVCDDLATRMTLLDSTVQQLNTLSMPTNNHIGDFNTAMEEGAEFLLNNIMPQSLGFIRRGVWMTTKRMSPAEAQMRATSITRRIAEAVPGLQLNVVVEQNVSIAALSQQIKAASVKQEVEGIRLYAQRQHLVINTQFEELENKIEAQEDRLLTAIRQGNDELLQTIITSRDEQRTQGASSTDAVIRELKKAYQLMEEMKEANQVTQHQLHQNKKDDEAASISILTSVNAVRSDIKEVREDITANQATLQQVKGDLSALAVAHSELLSAVAEMESRMTSEDKKIVDAIEQGNDELLAQIIGIHDNQRQMTEESTAATIRELKAVYQAMKEVKEGHHSTQQQLDQLSERLKLNADTAQRTIAVATATINDVMREQKEEVMDELGKVSAGIAGLTVGQQDIKDGQALIKAGQHDMRVEMKQQNELLLQRMAALQKQSTESEKRNTQLLAELEKKRLNADQQSEARFNAQIGELRQLMKQEQHEALEGGRLILASQQQQQAQQMADLQRQYEESEQRSRQLQLDLENRRRQANQRDKAALDDKLDKLKKQNKAMEGGIQALKSIIGNRTSTAFQTPPRVKCLGINATNDSPCSHHASPSCKNGYCKKHQDQAVCRGTVERTGEECTRPASSKHNNGYCGCRTPDDETRDTPNAYAIRRVRPPFAESALGVTRDAAARAVVASRPRYADNEWSRTRDAEKTGRVYTVAYSIVIKVPSRSRSRSTSLFLSSSRWLRSSHSSRTSLFSS